MQRGAQATEHPDSGSSPRYVHSAEAWLQAMRAAGSGTPAANMQTIRSLRVSVQKETVAVVKSDPALNCATTAPTISHRCRQPIGVCEGRNRPAQSAQAAKIAWRPPMVRVVQGDCLQHAQLLSTSFERVAVLSMAARESPGGGWQHGAGAQEENLHRRSTLFRSLQQAGQLYPIPDDGVLYSPDVSVFRGPESEGYPFHTPFTVAIISCAAHVRPDLVYTPGNPPHLSPHSVKRLKEKIIAILEVAEAHEQEGLVLSALGCGAFHNPPDHVASIFQQVFSEFFCAPVTGGVGGCVGGGSGGGEGRRGIKEIVFAIFDDHNARCKCGHNPRGNLLPFQQTFASE